MQYLQEQTSQNVKHAYIQIYFVKVFGGNPFSPGKLSTVFSFENNYSKKKKKILGENLSEFLKNLGISIANILFHNQIIPGIVFHKGSSVNFKFR